MGWPKCNQSEEWERIDEIDIMPHVDFHRLGLILSALFGLISIVFSFYLIWRHATHYLKPWEQRHIIRILFMVPIYSTVSFVSFIFYRHAIYFAVIRDCYEAFAIASFFSLLCHYIAPDLHSQKDYFRGITPKNWVWPLPWLQHGCLGSRDHGPFRVPRSGLTWFNVIWLGIFQYCFVRVFMTIVAVITEATGLYCLESLNPAFAHIWVMVIEGGCVSIAMYCIIQFYVQIRNDLAEHKPLLKVAAIKLVIFLSFWQTLVISFLTSSGAIKSSSTIQTPDIKVGIPALLLCIEMAIFSTLHQWAFPWQVYDIRRSDIIAAESAPGFLPDPKSAYQGGPFGIKALAEAFNPWDIIKNVGRAFRWFWVGRKVRHQDISYKQPPSNNDTGLEPTRNQFTAFNAAGHAGSSATNQGLDRDPYAGAAVAGGGYKSGQYTPLSDQDEPPAWPANKPSSNPNSKGPRSFAPPEYGVTEGSGAAGHLAPGSTPDKQRRTVSGGTGSMESQDSTAYRAASNLTPDAHPLGPPSRNSHEQLEWERHDGGMGASTRGQSERELGGGHGVRDNRF